MKTIKYPEKAVWEKLSARPGEKRENLEKTVGKIIDDVRREGDEAVLRYSRQFDFTGLNNIQVSDEEIINAEKMVPDDLKEAIALAKNQHRKIPYQRTG